jgi:5'-methylthioadenosine phosphorylase
MDRLAYRRDRRFRALCDAGALEDEQEIPVASAFGEPSGPVVTGPLGGVRFSFIARHGQHHQLSPGPGQLPRQHRRAQALRGNRRAGDFGHRLAARGPGAGQFVAVDQFIDRTGGRARAASSGGVVAHVSLADPVCAALSALAADAARRRAPRVHRGGTYLAIEGPQFSTRAESLLVPQWGAHVIGMTAMPEARLAREAELPYALLGMVTDYDCWRDAEGGRGGGRDPGRGARQRRSCPRHSGKACRRAAA